MIVIGLGGNVGSDDELVARFRVVRERFGATRSAALFRTAPLGPAQAPFVNTAIRCEVDGDEDAVMEQVRAIEHELGRVRDVRWGPRTIDIDVLVWDGRLIAKPDLIVPHPRLHERRFALEPLVELVGGDFVIPGVGRADEQLARVSDQDCALIAAGW